MLYPNTTYILITFITLTTESFLSCDSAWRCFLCKTCGLEYLAWVGGARVHGYLVFACNSVVCDVDSVYDILNSVSINCQTLSVWQQTDTVYISIWIVLEIISRYSLYPCFNEVERGYTGFTWSIHPSVHSPIHPSVDGIVSTLCIFLNTSWI